MDSPNLKLPNQAIDLEHAKDTIRYISQFDYHIVLNVGPSYSTAFKETYTWCEQHLGTKYKDWYMLINGAKGQVVLHVNDTKWLTIFRLTFPEVIDHSYQM